MSTLNALRLGNGKRIAGGPAGDDCSLGIKRVKLLFLLKMRGKVLGLILHRCVSLFVTVALCKFLGSPWLWAMLF